MKKTHPFILTFVVILCLCQVAVKADKIIVDASGGGDYTTIQEAIDNSFDGDIVEVSPGTYHEQINFYGLAITVTGTNPDEMGTVYGTVINGGMAGNTVTFDSGESNSSVLRGLTVENGGTGIYCYYSDPSIHKCVIRYSKDAFAAGIKCSYASPTIDSCNIRENNAIGISGCNGPITECKVVENIGDGIRGCNGLILRCDISENGLAGLYSCNGEINECNVIGNSTGLDRCDGQIRHSVIQNNRTYGIISADGAEVLNCIISGNKSHGVYNFYGQLKNCTIVGNKSNGIRTTNLSTKNTTTLINNIIVNNGGYGIQKYNNNTTLMLKHNNIWGNGSGNYYSTVPGETDTHSNPRFAVDGYWDEDDVWVEGDYHLKSIAGRWSDGNWIHDTITSPCIDAGDPTGGYFSEPSPNGGRINQGVYGGSIYASKSPFGIEPYCTEEIPGDVNDDCKLDMTDLAEIFSHWLECNLEPATACDE